MRSHSPASLRDCAGPTGPRAQRPRSGSETTNGLVPIAWRFGMKVCVSGASGQLGRLVAQELMGRLAGGEIVLVSRTPEALPDFSDRGVEVRYGDFDVPDSLVDAFSGCDRLLLIILLAGGGLVGQR